MFTSFSDSMRAAVDTARSNALSARDTARSTALSARESVTMPHVRERAGAFVVALTATTLIAGGGVASAATSAEDAASAGGAGPTAEEAVESVTAADNGDDGDQADAQDSDWVVPISDDYELSATFGNEGDNWGSGHSGTDFAVPTGTPVQTVHEGTVVKSGPNGGGDGPAYGNAVVVEHPDGSYSQYAHLDATEVEVGEQIETGDQIGLSGNTGNSTGPHLHFEIRTTADFGSAVDPAEHLREQGVTL